MSDKRTTTCLHMVFYAYLSPLWRFKAWFHKPVWNQSRVFIRQNESVFLFHFPMSHWPLRTLCTICTAYRLILNRFSFQKTYLFKYMYHKRWWLILISPLSKASILKMASFHYSYVTYFDTMLPKAIWPYILVPFFIFLYFANAYYCIYICIVYIKNGNE